MTYFYGIQIQLLLKLNPISSKVLFKHCIIQIQLLLKLNAIMAFAQANPKYSNTTLVKVKFKLAIK